MKVCFISNYLNHHQIPFCDEMAKVCEDFKFIALSRIPLQRIALGYKDVSSSYDYFVQSSLRSPDLKKYVEEYDFVIFGAGGQPLYQMREATGKPFFLYSERFLKKSALHLFWPKTFVKLIPYMKVSKNGYLLCAGAYVGKDYGLIGAFRGRKLKWGYFPAFVKEDLSKIEEGRDKRSILWVGRMIDWKRPELALYTLEYLLGKGYDVHLKYVGNGPLEPELKEYCNKKGISDKVAFLGGKSPDEVRSVMRESDVLLATSNKREGWGAVINEAMNSGCKVVASNAMGSAGYLIESGKNGFLFKGKNKSDLFKKTEMALNSSAEIRINAVERIEKLWSPEVAAKRLIQIMEGLNNNDLQMFDCGPCSKA